MFEITITGFFTLNKNNKQLLDGITSNPFFSGSITDGKTKLKIRATLSKPIEQNSPAVFEIIEGSISKEDIGKAFKEVA